MSGVSWKDSLLVSLPFGLNLRKSLLKGLVLCLAWVGDQEGDPGCPWHGNAVLADTSFEETVDTEMKLSHQEEHLEDRRPELNLRLNLGEGAGGDGNLVEGTGQAGDASPWPSPVIFTTLHGGNFSRQQCKGQPSSTSLSSIHSTGARTAVQTVAKVPEQRRLREDPGDAKSTTNMIINDADGGWTLALQE